MSEIVEGVVRPALEWLEDEDLVDEQIHDTEKFVRRIQVQAVRAALHHYGHRAAMRKDPAAAVALLDLDPETLVP